jgi:hypothetical protein
MNQQLIKMLFDLKQRQQKMTFEQALDKLWSMDLIRTGEMAERALIRRNRSGLRKNSRNQKASDFSDNSEHKYVTVRYDTKTTGRANVTGLDNKKGLLRVMCYEPKTQTNYFFRVPYRVYKNVVSPKIYFDGQGHPKTPTRKGSNFDMWRYKCTAEQWAGK